MSDLRRQLSGMLLAANAEPRSKRARTGDADELRALLAEDAVTWQVAGKRFGSVWPRLRAHVAVDLHFTSRTRNPPRVDKLVKFILDELGGAKGNPIAYRDDRQVKLLYARHHTRGSAKDPSVHAEIRTVAQTYAGVRRASELSDRWDVGYANHSYTRGQLFQGSDHEWDEGTAFGAEMKLRGMADQVFKFQETALRATDIAASGMVASLAHRRSRVASAFGDTTQAWRDLLRSPYAMPLGVLPERHGDLSFSATAVKTLSAFAIQRSDLVPVFPPIGLTLFVVENSGGKDLDNIVLDVLPGLLEVFRPTEFGRGMWSGLDELASLLDSGRSPSASADVQVAFVEAISVPAAAVPFVKRGSVVLALSHGDRVYSWWSSYNEFVREAADREWDSR